MFLQNCSIHFIISFLLNYIILQFFCERYWRPMKHRTQSLVTKTSFFFSQEAGGTPMKTSQEVRRYNYIKYSKCVRKWAKWMDRLCFLIKMSYWPYSYMEGHRDMGKWGVSSASKGLKLKAPVSGMRRIRRSLRKEASEFNWQVLNWKWNNLACGW